MATAEVIKPGSARAAVPPFTPEHEELRETCRRFVATELAPFATQWEEDRWFPQEVFEKMAAAGLLGLKYPESLGGQGGDYLHDAVLVEELARCGSGGLAAGIGAHIGIATPPIFKFGTEEQKERFLAPAIRGTSIGALAITEPDAGSDVAGLKTHAAKVDGGWVVNGSKMFITNGVRAGFWVTAVRTGADPRHGGISFLIIEPQGAVHTSKIEKLGWHASDTALMSFDDVFVPEENLLGELDGGFKLIMANFQWERLLMALGSVEAAQAAFEKTLEYVGERTAFGRPIGKYQVSRHKLAECAVQIQAGRDLTYHCLRLFHNGQDAMREVTMAKLFTQRMCVDVMDDCLQLFGGAGYMAEYPMERALRDARLGPIGGGTDEIMKEILGKTMGL